MSLIRRLTALQNSIYYNKLETSTTTKARAKRGHAMTKTPRKYALNDNPCGNCRRSAHANCRPLLDGTLCTCECAESQLLRATIKHAQDQAKAEGREITVEAAVHTVRPGYKVRYK